jgi:hypothetical protein
MAPTVIAYNEVYNAIQNNVISASENEAAGVEQMKFFEVAPDLAMTQHAITIRPLCFSGKTFISLAFGLVTPPYGLCLMISCSIAGIQIIDALRDVCIMLVPMLLVLVLVIVWPQVVLLLPSLVSPDFLK